MKDTFKVVAAFVGGLVLLFILGLYGLGWFKFFAPKEENIRREVFEQTKSYIHGKIQDLAKYYDEYQKSDSPESKSAIQELVKSQFADFDTNTISSQQLKTFLINMRGY